MNEPHFQPGPTAVEGVTGTATTNAAPGFHEWVFPTPLPLLDDLAEVIARHRSETAAALDRLAEAIGIFLTTA